MGSFNTTCFASMQTIAPGDKCFIFPVRQTSGYRPVEVFLGDDRQAPYGHTASTCYANAFWDPVGRLISATYDDCGRFTIEDTEHNRFTLAELVRKGKIRHLNFYTTEPGENKYHEPPFDPDNLDSEDPIKSLDYLWDALEEHRVFVRNHHGKPAQLQFAVIAKPAVDYLSNMANSGKDWSGRPRTVEAKIKEMESKYQTDYDLDHKHDFFFFRLDTYFGSGEAYRSPIHWYLDEILCEQKGQEAFTARTKEILRDLLYERRVFEGLEMLNLKIQPLVYTSQDYRNEIGESYAMFVRHVADEIHEARKDYFDDEDTLDEEDG